MTTRTLTFSQNKPQALESPIRVIEGVTSLVVTCNYWTTVTTVTSVTCWVNKQDKTSTIMPSGAVTGTTTSSITLKPMVIASAFGGKRIVVDILADGEVKQFVVIVRKDEIE